MKTPKTFVSGLVFLTIISITILPSSLEYSILTISIGDYLINYQLQAIFVILLAQWALNRKHFAPIFLVLCFIFFSGVLNTNRYPSTLAFYIAASCYMAPFMSIYWTRNFATSNKHNLRLIYAIFFTISLQGIGVLLFSHALGGLTGNFMSFGEDVRGSFENYRFGSTLASANTSGIFVSSCFLCLWATTNNPKERVILATLLTLSLIGFQSRSGLLAIAAYFSIDRNIATSRKIVIFITLALGFMIIATLRDGDEVSSSNLVRLYYFSEAYELITTSEWIVPFFGTGPGMGISRNLTSYYGIFNHTENQLLSGAESFLAVSLVEIGLTGTLILLSTMWVALKRDNKAIIIYLTYIAIDPSNIRFFESFLMGYILATLTSNKKYNPKPSGHSNSLETTTNKSNPNYSK